MLPGRARYAVRRLTSLPHAPYARPAMKITAIRATWLRAPIPAEHAHVSDFGRNDTFNMCLVEIETDTGLTGLGEAKAAVGNLGNYAAMVTLIREEMAPVLIGRASCRERVLACV